MQTTPASIPQLTVTRFVAAFSVVVFHYGQTVFPFRGGMLHYFAAEGKIAVSYFFFLSGFLLYVVYSQSSFSARQFFAARFARIFPLYIFAFVVTVVLILFFLDERPKLITVILQGIFLHAWFPGNALALNYPSWSVSVEVFFYLLFPFLLLLSRKINAKYFIAVAGILWLLSVFQFYEFQHYFYDEKNKAAIDFIFYFPLWHLNTFISGIAGGIIFLKLNNKNILRGWTPVLIAAAGFISACIILLTENRVKEIATNGLLAPFYAMIVIGIALDKTIVSKIMSVKIVQFLGEISYGIYLLQFAAWIIAAKLIEYFKLQNHPAIGFYGFIFFLVLVSSLAYYFIEKPGRIYLRKYGMKGNSA